RCQPCLRTDANYVKNSDTAPATKSLAPGFITNPGARVLWESSRQAFQVRDILAAALVAEPLTMVDLLGTDEGAAIEFEPTRLGLSARPAGL
ncbi:MAG TPA: hypothetical protein PKC73_11235, partial [Dermatophilaceae bacterium]|nr:hypothetical protein [Dermatophilaceae bacterium]HMT90196.1 hypothetical protein [Dermatophilaceae bacterium]